MEYKIMQILNEVCGAEDGELKPDLDLFETGLLDSFAVVQLLVEFEERLHVTLDIETLRREDIATPALIVRLLEKMR
ncbi:MAG: D-alanine--poly(phosphoribitol) ligase subunit DltC [Oscillospiraceae bacterium]|nr:D-alanine--poly(phosphoribitol) ligase subunit DltC [Oscillospiraceae bacterium]